MSNPTLAFIDCPDAQGSHRMAYWHWGNPTSRHVVLCVHGLTRQGRDFDTLAQALCEQAGGDICVVCPDVAGRGQSDWLKDPQGYQLPFYAADMLALLAQLQPTRLDWVGTSMGGLIGLVVAGQPDLPPFAKVHRLVLNDVGPVIEWQALQRIGQYLGQVPVFDTEQQAADALWAIASSFGPHTPEQWLALTRPQIKPLADGSGRLTLRYDPALAEPFKAMTLESAAQGEALLWQAYDQISAQTLLVRGAESDLLSATTAQAMTQRGPKAQLVEFAGVGHAPTFVAQPQVDAVRSFLLAPDH
ncbi:alpha/beta fold hydrolase [Rhodoferax fermentans]|uniref:Alpha/beta hydrolase n=1 Tax=Rhodoferax fermentans TaxID=28066 RepID=A0A1T1AV59_RHOFE|nr:alpha/beta hydrolase [Rhodoferax fermentans]MBK1682000.1 alpha/beta hydrolase [Rhodoferax fermentans]OOV07992.1 alpha/beta hydrolase [Rhodoferax fermentans]